MRLSIDVDIDVDVDIDADVDVDVAIKTVQALSKSELSSRFLSRSKSCCSEKNIDMDML